jgi:hypothetical protein
MITPYFGYPDWSLNMMRIASSSHRWQRSAQQRIIDRVFPSFTKVSRFRVLFHANNGFGQEV